MSEVTPEGLAACLVELGRCGLVDFALAGSWARRLDAPKLADHWPQDVDLVVAHPDVLPDLSRSRLLVRHHHPETAAGGLILQVVDPLHAVRVDLFLAPSSVLARAARRPTPGGDQRVLASGDLAGSLLALAWPLTLDRPVPGKYAAALRDLSAPDPVWADYRPEDAPERFAEARTAVMTAAAAAPRLLIDMTYSQDVTRVCRRCRPTAALPLADPSAVKKILGYV